MEMDTIIQTLSPALKLALLKTDDQEYLYDLEEKITRFLNDAQSDKLFLEPNLNSYYRMLSYNVAEYYKLRHILLKQDNRLALYKQDGVDGKNVIVQMDESRKLKNLCQRKLAESLQMTEQEIAALNSSSDKLLQDVPQVVNKRRHSSPDLHQRNTSPTLSFFTMPSESTSSMTSSLSFDNKSNNSNDRRSDSSMSSVEREGKKASPKKSARKRTSAAKKKNNNYSHISHSHNGYSRKHVHSQYNNDGYRQYWMGPQQQFVPQVYMYPSYTYVPETEYLAMGDDIEGEEFMEESTDTPRGSHATYVPMPYMYGPPSSLPPPHMGACFQLMPVTFPPQYPAQHPMQFHPQYPFPPPPQPYIFEQNEEVPPSC